MVSQGSDESQPQNEQFRAEQNQRDAEITHPVTLDAEGALAIALSEAAKAGRFDVVAQLARELESRRLAAAGNVTPISAAKKSGR